MTPVGILLAAGRGHRFDPSGARNKLLERLPGGELVVVASARNLLAVLPRVIAVVPPGGEAVASALRALGCEVTCCPDAAQGMGASLVHALRHSLPAAQSWVIALGDMPFVRPQTIRSLADAVSRGAAIAAPALQGRRGNPVAFGSQYLPELLALQGDEGARHIVRSHPVTLVEVDDPGILRDIDAPADLGGSGE